VGGVEADLFGRALAADGNPEVAQASDSTVVVEKK
jgi:hypothetical protein